MQKKTFVAWCWHQFKMSQCRFTLQSLTALSCLILLVILKQLGQSRRPNDPNGGVYLALGAADSYLSGEKSPPRSPWRCHAQAAIYDFSTPSSCPSSCLFLCPCDLKRAENGRFLFKKKCTNISTCIFSTSGPHKWRLRHRIM